MHVKGHLRDAFLETVEERSGAVWNLPPETPVEGDHRGRQLTWGRLLGLLWNCTAIVPGFDCELLGFPQGSTYATIVRGLRYGEPRLASRPL